MTSVNDVVLDGSLSVFLTRAERLVYTVGESTSYAQANALQGGGGNQAGAMPTPTFSGIEDGTPNGRQVRKLAQVSSVNAGYDSSPDEVTHYAILDDTNSVLLTTGALTSPITTSTSDPIEVTADFVALRQPDVT